jgi:hypothetical protein
MRAGPILALALGGGFLATASYALADIPCPAVAPMAAQGAGPPPPLLVERQPPMPAYGYEWTPGYWGWNPVAYDYYWVPGVWVEPPAIGLLWTPPWWGWVGGVYVFTPGYWGATVGFYGGIDYGYGYGGYGYDGGYWRGRTFFYNREVTNFGGVHVNAVFNRAVFINRGAGRVSFNGGPGGVRLAASRQQLAAARAAHVGATAAQASHAMAAAGDPGRRAGAFNHGRLAAAAVGGAGAALAAHSALHGHGPLARGPALHGQHGPAQLGAGGRRGARFANIRSGPRARVIRGAAPRSYRAASHGGRLGPHGYRVASHSYRGGGGYHAAYRPSRFGGTGYRAAAPRYGGYRASPRGFGGGGFHAANRPMGGFRPAGRPSGGFGGRPSGGLRPSGGPRPSGGNRPSGGDHRPR